MASRFETELNELLLIANSDAALDKKAALLLSRFDSLEGSAKVAALCVMDRVRHPSIIQKLQETVSDEDRSIRSQALVSLARLNDPIAFETAVKWICHGDDLERQVGLAAAAYFKTQRADELFELLFRAGEPPYARRAAAEVLALRGNRTGEAFLENELETADGSEKDFPAVALARLNNKRGLLTLKRLVEAAQPGTSELSRLRRLFQLHLGLEPQADEGAWKASAVGWVNGRLGT